MPLPATIRVKLSSEAAEAISITPVVVQEMPVRELIEHILGITGKDLPRICDLLRRGSLISGGSRFRWEGQAPDAGEVAEVLETFPDAESGRPFAAEKCIKAILRGGRTPIEIQREAGTRKGLFQRNTFWEMLMQMVESGALSYAGYSYRDRADKYIREFSSEELSAIREGSDAVRYSTLREQIRSVRFVQAELYALR